MSDLPETMRQLRSLVTADRRLRLSIDTVKTPSPGPGEVLVRVEAAPINPSDLGLLFGSADVSDARRDGGPDDLALTAPISAAAIRALAGRIGQPLAAGNEGAGTVVAAGDSDDARALLGRLVGFAGGEAYAQYRVVAARSCLPVPEGTTPAQAASSFVNPMTALSMVEAMRLEGHTGLVHTAAASNLGRMLNRVCLADGVPLVNVVRRAEQAALLRDEGAAVVCDSSLDSFDDDLTAALAKTGATLAFDATGGGTLAGRILAAMERVAVAAAPVYSRYGSDVNKQVYVYGGLEPSPMVLNRAFGMRWGIGGWLVSPFLGRLGTEGFVRLRSRVAAELTSTFVSTYTDEITLAQMLDPDVIRRYAKQATGQKFLVLPNAELLRQ